MHHVLGDPDICNVQDSKLASLSNCSHRVSLERMGTALTDASKL